MLVGDRVTVGAVDWVDGRGGEAWGRGGRPARTAGGPHLAPSRVSPGVVEAVHPRLSALADPAVANVDHVLLVFALASPPFDPRAASRFLVAAEAARLPVSVVLNKADLVAPEDAAAAAAEVAGWGYGVATASAAADGGLDALASALAGRTSVFTGPSGVGKSSLINALLQRERRGGDGEEGGGDPSSSSSPLSLLATKTVSKSGRGRHTTRHVSLIPVAGGLLADTPGFNQPDVALVARGAAASASLAHLFPEARPRIGTCEFSNCAHLAEPGCGVRDGWARWPW